MKENKNIKRRKWEEEKKIDWFGGKENERSVFLTHPPSLIYLNELSFQDRAHTAHNGYFQPL